MTPEQIEDRRKFLRGITSPDDWVNALCDLALKGLQAEAMREAIRRAMEKMSATYGDARVYQFLESIRVDLEQALNERKET
jgi:hypothetical protein